MITKHLNEPWTVGMSFAGTWHNQHNSEIEIKVGIEGQITGTFTTAADGSKNLTGEFPVTGFVSQDVIAFCVNFAEHGCVTSWVGQMTRGKDGTEIIETLWHMAVDVGNSDKLRWKSIVSGADTFLRGKRPNTTSVLTTQASHPLFMDKDEDLTSAY